MKIKRILSGILAVAMLGTMSMSVSAETQSTAIPEDMPKIESIEELEAYYDSIGLDYSMLSQEEKEALFQSILDMTFDENGNYEVGLTNDDESGVVTCIWSVNQDYAVGPKYDDYVHYIIHDGEAYITGVNEVNTEITEYVIPDEIDGFPVVAIGGYAFKRFTNLEKITIPNTVRRIGKWAFHWTPLKEIELSHPDEHSDLQIVRQQAFLGTMLESVTCFKDSDLETIEWEAFDSRQGYCLKNFAFPDHKMDIDVEAMGTPFTYEYEQTGKIVLPDILLESVVEKIESYIENTPQYYPETKDMTEGEFKKYVYDCAWIELQYMFDFPVAAVESNAIELESKAFVELEGDVDFDGKVGTKDIALVKNYLLSEGSGKKTDSSTGEEIEILSTVQKFAASIDNSANVDVKSLLSIKKAALQ